MPRALLALAVALLPTAAAAWPDALDGHGGPIRGLAGGEGEMLSASFDYTIIRWRLSEEKAEVAARLVGHEAAVNDVAYVPGGRLAVSASDDGSVGLWDLEAGELAQRFAGSGEKVLDVAVSPDGTLAASAGWDHAVRVYDVAAREEVAVLEGHDGNVNAVAFAPDGRTLYSGGYDGTVRRWDLETMRAEAPLVRHGWGVNVLQALPGETLLYGAADGVVGLVDLRLGQELKSLPPMGGPVLSVAFDEASGRVAVGSAKGELVLYDLADWSVVARFETPYGPIWGLAFAPDGRAIYRAGLDDRAFLWRFDPANPFEPLDEEFPRRFQVGSDDGMGAGEREFRRKCSVCHTLTPDGENRAGPTLYRLFGRKAGTVPGYPYSDALKELDIVWTEETVSQLFDHGPDIVTPGSKMPLQRLKNDLDRDALVAYLKEATEPSPADDTIMKGDGG
ncbi:c-type cytochrome [Lutibaculum baratangense]|uniref:WD domain/cytochrome c family protein n=1 Tax=Lutibaculum baratangense AMV1 TaxID=631454 RepID=V4QSX3_9HYPH|nr:c-type cytochrome [Lutibaculum baratangense]ESR22867.1 WD domain/cytochrome c family protein [Lutibaculum baratangense AMV1]